MIENTFGINLTPENEESRIKALRRYRITDTPSEDSFDGIARLTAKIFNVPVSLLSLVDSESVFFKANVGMGAAREANRGSSLCALAILDKDVTVFEDALNEPCLMANPNVTGNFGLRFYAGAPLITHDGFLIGTLCIIDKAARTFTDGDKEILEGLAQTAMDQIELRRSALDKIDELQKVNTYLDTARIDLDSANDELAEFNNEMEAANEELNTTNEQLFKTHELTVLLNKDLQTSQQRLQSFISKAPIAFGILTGRKLVIEVANEMILRIWDRTPEVLGKPLAVAMPELLNQPYLSILDNVFVTGNTYVGDTAPVKMDINGKYQTCYFDFIYEPLKDENNETVSIIVIANDVTERINKGIELERLNRQLEIALHAGELGSYNLDLTTGKMKCSTICKANYGRSEDEKFDLEDLMATINPEHREKVNQQILESIKNNIPYHAEYLIRWPDGSEHWMNASGLPIYDDQGTCTHMIGVTVDITKRKNYETQKDDFLGIASHEFKTPITTLKATLQLLQRLKDRPAHEMFPRLIDQSVNNLEKLSKLVDDLLNIHRVTGGHLELSKEWFSARELLESCCDHIRIEGRYELVLHGDLNAMIFADRHRIDQVIVNFVNNAVKYATNSRIIKLIVNKMNDGVKITVQDRGDGIADEIQPFLFERYYRASHKGKSYSGLGLGLYISSEIIKKHGGEIGVDSRLGKGSGFWFTIPIPEKEPELQD